jgi:hypothetical protein
MQIRTLTKATLALALLFPGTHGWQSTNDASRTWDRRQALVGMGSAAFGLLIPSAANAGIDPNALKSLAVQGDESGASQRLRQVEAIQRPTSDLVDVPFNDLPSGVSYREYREGRGEVGKLFEQDGR